MSELKVIDVDKMADVMQLSGQFYRKPEIAELEERIADGDKDFEMANSQNERLLKFVRHHKHKRCLAMAQVLEHVCPITNMKAKWRDKWHKLWLELAEKFKE